MRHFYIFNVPRRLGYIFMVVFPAFARDKNHLNQIKHHKNATPSFAALGIHT